MACAIVATFLVPTGARVAAARPFQSSTFSPADLERFYEISFVTLSRLAMHEEASLSTPAVGHIDARESAVVVGIKPGWARIALPPVGQGAVGWVPATTANLVERKAVDTMVVSMTLARKAWPQAVKDSVLLGTVRIGFSEEQTRLALGAPSTSATEETASGVVKVLTYTRRTVTFTGDRVTKIVSIELPGK